MWGFSPYGPSAVIRANPRYGLLASRLLALSPLFQPFQSRHNLLAHGFARVALGAHRFHGIRLGQPKDRIALVFVRSRSGAAVAGDFLLAYRVLVLFHHLHAESQVGVL